MKKTIVLIAVLLALLIPSTVFAGVGTEVTVVSRAYGCEQTSLVLSPANFYAEVAITIYANNQLVLNETYPASGNIDINISYDFPGADQVYVEVYALGFYPGGGQSQVEIIDNGIVLDCKSNEDPGDPKDPVTRPSDGRFCFAPGQARAAVYAVRDASGGTGISIWAIDAKDKGEPVITLSAAQLSDAAKKTDAVVVLGQSLLNSITFYQLRDANGKISYQINVGPVNELKVHECRFAAIPAPDAKVTSFAVGR